MTAESAILFVAARQCWTHHRAHYPLRIPTPGAGMMQPYAPDPFARTDGRKVEHGTRVGYRAHLAHGSAPCDECKKASAAYERERSKQRKKDGWRRAPKKRNIPSAEQIRDAWTGEVVPQLQVTESGCWEFTGRCWPGRSAEDPAAGRYGRLNIYGRTYKTHRIAAAVHLGLDIEDTAVKVLHACDNPPCCNPAHLSLGTDGDNVRDAITKGRMTGPPAQLREVCAKGHDLSVTRVPGTSKKRPDTECGVCRRDRKREYAREDRKRKAVAKVGGQP